MTRETYDRIKEWARPYCNGVDHLLSRMAGRERSIEVRTDDSRADDDPLLIDGSEPAMRLNRRDLRDLHDFMCEELFYRTSAGNGAA